MAVHLGKHFATLTPELRYQPVLKRVTVRLGDTTIARTLEAMLLWEPGRVVPSYAIPESDIAGELSPVTDEPVPTYRTVGFGDEDVLDPSIPFAVRTTPGDRVAVHAGHRRGSAFRLHDGDLPGYVVLDFDSFTWWEEDEELMAHPRDPFHRIDVLRSSRDVRISAGGTLLAHSTRPKLLFEGVMPMPRYYLPREDVHVELRTSDTRTVCAYKGVATHYSVPLTDGQLTDVAWSYEDPLHDAQPVAGLICFYQERLDTEVDGVAVSRPRTPWS